MQCYRNNESWFSGWDPTMGNVLRPFSVMNIPFIIIRSEWIETDLFILLLLMVVVFLNIRGEKKLIWLIKKKKKKEISVFTWVWVIHQTFKGNWHVYDNAEAWGVYQETRLSVTYDVLALSGRSLSLLQSCLVRDNAMVTSEQKLITFKVFLLLKFKSITRA